MLLCWRWLSSVVPAMSLYGLWCCGMDDLFVWFWLWILLERQRKSGGCSFSACFETFKATSVFLSSSPSPLLGSVLPVFKDHHFLRALCYRVEFFYLFSFAGLTPVPLIFSGQRGKLTADFSFFSFSSKWGYCLSYPMTHQDLFICGCFEHSSPEGTDYLCPSKAFNILLHLVFLFFI